MIRARALPAIPGVGPGRAGPHRRLFGFSRIAGRERSPARPEVSSPVLAGRLGWTTPTDGATAGPRRRAVLAAALALPLAACAVPGPTGDAAAPPSPPADITAPVDDLERRFDARLGLVALDTGTGRSLVHRADERFAFCSTFKVLAAAALLTVRSLPRTDEIVRYGAADLMASSAVTREHVATGLSYRDLCAAAIQHSDGTAGNLLLRGIGGPAGLTRFLRDLGDTTTRMDRTEPFIADAVPGDVRDTTSPRAFAATLRAIVLGDVLPDRRAFLVDLLEHTATPPRIRAGVPAGWTVANKTGTGDYGAVNDVAVVWPPGRAPLVLALLSSRRRRDDDGDPRLLSEATRRVVAALT